MNSRFRGHEIEWDERQNAFVFLGTREPTIETHKDRPCGNCGLHKTPEGHDGCLGMLPGIMNACCGHGQSLDAYVQFWDGRRLSSNMAIDAIKKMKKQAAAANP